jgi:hypothetical protein
MLHADGNANFETIKEPCQELLSCWSDFYFWFHCSCDVQKRIVLLSLCVLRKLLSDLVTLYHFNSSGLRW